MGNLIPGETLVYERVGNIKYARYAGRPDIPRWEIGRTSTEADLFDYNDFCEMKDLAKDNVTLQKQFDILVNLYYIVKSEGKK